MPVPSTLPFFVPVRLVGLCPVSIIRPARIVPIFQDVKVRAIDDKISDQPCPLKGPPMNLGT